MIPILSLVYVAVLCTVAVFSRAYKDNLLQQWGLVSLAVGCISMTWHVWRVESIGWPCAVVLTGLVSFATGTAAKVVHFHRKAAPNAVGREKRKTA